MGAPWGQCHPGSLLQQLLGHTLQGGLRDGGGNIQTRVFQHHLADRGHVGRHAGLPHRPVRVCQAPGQAPDQGAAALEVRCPVPGLGVPALLRLVDSLELSQR